MEITDASGTINEPLNIEITPSLFYPATQAILGDALSLNAMTSLVVTPGTYQLAGGQMLPPGLILDASTGSITGTPEAPGLFAVTIEFTTNLQTVAAQLSLDIDSYSISLSYAPIEGETGQPVSVAPAVAGTKGTASYAISSGSLPAGLILDPVTGVISGTPTGSASSGSVGVTVTDLYQVGSTRVLIDLTAPPAFVPTQVPTVQTWGLLAMIMLLLGLGMAPAAQESGVRRKI